MMQTMGLSRSLVETKEQANDSRLLPYEASNEDEKPQKGKTEYQKTVAEIKDKRNKVRCHLVLTPNANETWLYG